MKTINFQILKKKLFLISVMIFAVISLLNAQTSNTLPYLIDSVVRSAPRLFMTIAGETIKIDNINDQCKKSLLTVKDAENTYIHVFSSFNQWIADYGIFKTKDEAHSKLNDVKQQLKLAYQNLSFMEIIPAFSSVPDYYITLTNNDTVLFYNMKLSCLSNNNNQYHLKYIVEGNKGKACSIKYIPINNPRTNTQFSQDIRMLVNEAASGFESLKGELVNNNYYKEYKANKCIAEAKVCLVRNYLFGKTYVASLGGGVSKEQLWPIISNIGGGVAQALGSEYFYHILQNNSGIGFTAKNKMSAEEHPVITVESMKDTNETYIILIIAHQPSKF
jgi:hypothetical protein